MKDKDIEEIEQKIRDINLRIEEQEEKLESLVVNRFLVREQLYGHGNLDYEGQSICVNNWVKVVLQDKFKTTDSRVRMGYIRGYQWIKTSARAEEPHYL